MQKIVNYSVIPNVMVTDYKPITGYKLAQLPTFWELIQMPFLEALQYLSLHKTKLVAIKSFSERIPPLRETIGYKQIEINLEDIVDLTSQLVYEYRRSGDGRLPTMMCIGHKKWRQIQRLNFMIPYDHNANLAIGNNDRSPFMWYRGMRVVLMNSIDGIVLLGDKELSES